MLQDVWKKLLLAGIGMFLIGTGIAIMAEVNTEIASGLAFAVVGVFLMGRIN